MHAVAALLGAAAAAYLAARALRVPAIPLLLLAGLGLSVLIPLEARILEDTLVLGVAFILFVAGLELDPRRMGAQRRAVLQVGIIQFVVLAALGFLAARALGFELVESAYVGLALTASSTLIGTRLLRRRQQMFEPFGRLVLGVLLLQDVLVLLAIPIVAELSADWQQMVWRLAGLAGLASLTLLARRWVAPLILRLATDEELVLLGSLAVLFLFLGATHLLALPLVVGAFFAGVALSRFPVNGVVRGELSSIGDFFAAIFFTALGALVRVPTMLELGQALVLTALVVVVTTPLVTVIAERTGLSARAGIEGGLLLSQTSEISLIIGLTGMIQGHIQGDVFIVIALTTLITMLLTPVLATDRVAWRLLQLHPARRQPERDPPSDHILLLGTGSTGMPLLEDLIITGANIVVVDDDPAVVDYLTEAGIRTVRGDASDDQVLRQAGAGRARIISSTIRRARDNERVLQIAGGVPVLVRVFDEADAAWVKSLGGTPILYSEATADGLMEWYLDQAEELDRSLEARTS